MKSKSHDAAMAGPYRKDPDFARQVINTILQDEDGDQGELLIVLRHMTKAFGGVKAMPEQAKLNPTQRRHWTASSSNMKNWKDLAWTFVQWNAVHSIVKPDTSSKASINSRNFSGSRLSTNRFAMKEPAVSEQPMIRP